MLASTNNLQYVCFDNASNTLKQFLDAFSKNPGLEYLFSKGTENAGLQFLLLNDPKKARTIMLQQLTKQLSELPLLPSSFRLGVLSNVNYSDRTHAILNDFLNNITPASNPIVLIHTTSTFSDPKFDVKYYYHEILENSKVEVVQLTPYCKTEMFNILTNISTQNRLMIDYDSFSTIVEKANGNASAAINMLQIYTSKKPVSSPNEIIKKQNVISSLFSPDIHRSIYSQIGKILYFNETKPKLDLSLIIAEVNTDKATLANSVYENMPIFLTDIREYATIMQYFSLSENMRNKFFFLSCMPALHDNLDYIQFHVSASAFLIFGKSKTQPNKIQELRLFENKAQDEIEKKKKTIFAAFSNLLQNQKLSKNVTEKKASIQNNHMQEELEELEELQELEEPNEEEKDRDEMDDAEHNKSNENEDFCQIQTQTSQKIFFSEIFPFIRDRQHNFPLSIHQAQLIDSLPKMVFQNRSFNSTSSNNNIQQNTHDNSKPGRKQRRRRRYYSKPYNANRHRFNNDKNPNE